MSVHEPSQPEFLGAHAAAGGSSTPRRRPARTGVVVVAAVAAVAAVGAGAFAVGQLMAGGSAPASAVPADAVLFASLDLEPSATQKIEAFRTLRKFPALRPELSTGSGDDLRRTLVERVVDAERCPGLSYADDVEPWIGQRVAVAVRPSGGSDVVPLMALQVTDRDQARQGVRALETCGSRSSSSGVAFTGDYVLVSDTTAHARQAAADAESAPLEDDADFETWMARVGDPGILTVYASQDAPGTLAGAAGTHRLAGRDRARLEAATRDFEGAAAVLRFGGGAVEVETTTKGLGSAAGGGAPSGPGVGTLPATTAVALSVVLPDGWLSDQISTVEGVVGKASVEALMQQGEAATGLRLPEDVATLLGHGFDVSVDSSADLRSLSRSSDPTRLPAGVRLKGDAAAITRVLDKLRSAAPDPGVLQVRTGNGVVAVGTDPAYVESLLEQGGLGDDDSFTRVVPEADRASSVLFVGFDAGHGWAERIADLASDGDPDVRRNLEPLDALGASGWVDEDEVQHGLLRLTTD